MLKLTIGVKVFGYANYICSVLLSFHFGLTGLLFFFQTSICFLPKDNLLIDITY